MAEKGFGTLYIFYSLSSSHVLMQSEFSEEDESHLGLAQWEMTGTKEGFGFSWME